MIHRFRRLGVLALSIGCMCLVAACGSSSKSSSAAGGTAPAGHFAGFKLTTTQRVCLKKKGVTLPNFRGIAAAVDRLLEPTTYAKYRAATEAQDNRAVFEITEILEKLLKK